MDTFIPFRKSIAWKLFIYYFLAIIIGSVLLVIPTISIKPGAEKIYFDDAFFIATSAFTDTGLTPVNVSHTFTIFGQILIMLFIQIGGIGLVSFKYLIWSFILGLPSSLNEESILHAEKGGTKKVRSTSVIRKALLMFFFIEFIGFLVFTSYFLANEGGTIGNEIGDNISPFVNKGQAIFYGLFHSISSMNNAGFDIFGGRSLAMFNHDQFIQVFTLILFVIGGIGFPILYDLSHYLWSLFVNKKRKKLLLLTKITLVSYFLVMVIGVLLAVISEAIVASNTEYIDSANNIKVLFKRNDYSDYEKWMNLFFHTSSARSAGFSYYPINNFSPATRSILGILMFIGAGPSSTGGGIRVSSLFVVIVALVTYRKNNNQVNVFKRTLDEKNRKSAYRSILSSIFIVIGIGLFVVLAMGLNTQIGYSKSQESLFFETVSAFGTTGLSYKGTTRSLTTIAKLFIAIIMIVGQLGMNNMLTIFRREGKVTKQKIKNYPIEYVVGI